MLEVRYCDDREHAPLGVIMRFSADVDHLDRAVVRRTNESLPGGSVLQRHLRRTDIGNAQMLTTEF